MSKAKTNDQFVSEMKSIDESIKINGKYINNHTKIQCECMKCGYMWQATPNSLLCG